MKKPPRKRFLRVDGTAWLVLYSRLACVRIAYVLKTYRFSDSEDLEQTLLRYVALYNHQLPQSALKSKTPMKTEGLASRASASAPQAAI